MEIEEEIRAMSAANQNDFVVFDDLLDCNQKTIASISRGVRDKVSDVFYSLY